MTIYYVTMCIQFSYVFLANIKNDNIKYVPRKMTCETLVTIENVEILHFQKFDKITWFFSFFRVINRNMSQSMLVSINYTSCLLFYILSFRGHIFSIFLLWSFIA